jgi:membrane protein implicated in regulation of membrane protease activity
MKNGLRWFGFILAMVSAFLLSGGNPDVQWMGWAVGTVSSAMWVYFGFKDSDTPRALMEVMYLLLAMRGIYNWRAPTIKEQYVTSTNGN